MLTEKEQIKISELKIGFNIVPENTNYNYMSSRRVEISRVWARKLLRASTVLNVMSIILIALSFIVSLSKPSPDFYASTPSGKVYPITKLKVGN